MAAAQVVTREEYEKLAKGIEAITARMTGMAEKLTPVEGLLKLLDKPASRSGMSPVELISKMTDGGNLSGVFGGDGEFLTGNARQPRFKSMGKDASDWLMSLYRWSDNESPYDRRSSAGTKLEKSYGVQRMDMGPNGIFKTALAEASGSTGGYTVPPMFAEKLLAIAVEDQVMAPSCSTMPMSALTLQVPSLDLTTRQTAGTTPFLGGVLATWNAESAGINESEPQFRQTELKAHQLSLYMIASNTLLADNAIGLDALLTTLMSQAIGFYTEYAYLQGTGVGQPLGILNAPAALSVTRAVASTIQYIDVAKMFGSIYFPLISSGRMMWLTHQSCLQQILQLNDNTLNTTTGRQLFVSIDQGAVKTPLWQLLGIPLKVTEKLPALGTNGCLMLIDASKYLLGHRADLQIDVSPHVKFLNNQMVWRVIWRGDGQPWLNNSIRLTDGAQTVSPFVFVTQ